MRLKVCRLRPDAPPTGELVGAIERMAVTRQARVADALCVARTTEGELAAIDLPVARAGAGIVDLLDFRLAPDRRRKLTARTLTQRPDGVAPATVRAIGETLGPGTAVVAFLVTGTSPLLDAAVARCGGWMVADVPTTARALAGLDAVLLKVVATSPRHARRGAEQ